jgi:amino-acid N-acetyltransferase
MKANLLARMSMMIRKAVIEDVNPIHKLLSHFADLGLLLPRSLSELYNHLRDYFVLEDEDGVRRIQGVAGLGICWEDLAEIRSLAVTETLQGRGFGSQLLDSCLEEARFLGLKKIFTLTYAPGFFKDHGFKAVEKSVLPHKVWADCLKCPKFPNCDEIAMIRHL